jgi:hypothetical protein
MPNTYTELDKITVGTATNSVTFTNIPQGYTDLVLVTSVGSNNPVEIMVFQVGNGSVDTGSNYSTTYILGNGSTASSGRFSNLTYGALDRNLGVTTTTGGLNTITHFMNYSNTTTNKTILSRANQVDATYNGAEAMVNLWRSTVAINTLKAFITNGVLFNVGSTFSLYGIANADQGAAKATGGIITEDATYWYHTFAASGTFTPKQALTVDCLVLAGGGAGGSYAGGGGGAGGLRTATGLSLTTTPVSVTVGAGGVGATGLAGGNGVNSVFDTITSTGGGGGGGFAFSTNGVAGGSGGGATASNAGSATGGAASPSGQGNAGGNTSNSGVGAGAGGGGAGAVGGSSTSSVVAGNGGAGLATSFSGTSVTYAGGGGGGADTASGQTAGTGGVGGGGNGALSAPTTGTANTGGGGGGRWNPSAAGANGGSGLVIVRYLKA